MLGWIGFVLMAAAMVAVAAPGVLTLYGGRLRCARRCPHCHTVTGQLPPRGPLERAYGALTASAVRSCTRCGWAGRMRWRLAPERVGGHR